MVRACSLECSRRIVYVHFSVAPAPQNGVVGAIARYWLSYLRTYPPTYLRQVYTGVDYADIIEHLNDFWKIETVTGLGPEAQEAQEYLGKLPLRFRKLAKRQQKQLQKTPREVRPWPWINMREC